MACRSTSIEGRRWRWSATYSDRTHPQGASSDPGEGSLARRLNGRQLYVWHAVDSEGEGLTG
jgi:hypothetical protein